MRLSCPGCGLELDAPHECMYRSFEKGLMIRLIIKADEPPPQIPGVDEYTLRTVTSLRDLIEKIRIFDAGLNDAVIEMSKLTMAAANTALHDAHLQFQTIDDRGDLTFAAIAKELPSRLLTIPAALYDRNLRNTSHNLVPESEQKGKWLLIDRDYIKGFSFNRGIPAYDRQRHPFARRAPLDYRPSIEKALKEAERKK